MFTITYYKKIVGRNDESRIRNVDTIKEAYQSLFYVTPGFCFVP